MKRYICSVLFVLSAVHINAAPPVYKQVTELPADIPTCSEKDLNINECIKAAFQQMIPSLKDGRKELNIPPLDPFILEKSSHQFNSGIIQGRISMKNVRVSGLSDATVKSVDFKLKDGKLRLKMTTHIPKMYIEGNYKADMKLNEAKLTPKGFFNISMTDVTMKARPEGELYERDGHTYLRFTKFENEPEIGDMRLYASGLVADPALNEVMLDFVNQSWRSLYKTMLPDARTTWEPLLINGVNEFFAALPFDLLIKKN